MSSMRRVIRWYLAISALLLLIWSGCFKIPETPKWSMPFTIPFSEKTYTMRDLIKVNALSFTDTALLRVVYQTGQGFYGLNDSLFFFVTGAIDTQTFYDKLTTDAQDPRPFTYTVDSVALDSLRCGGADFSASQFGFPIGTPVPFSRTRVDTTRPYDSPGVGFLYFDYFDYQSGTLACEINNQFPVDMDTVSFDLIRTTGGNDVVVGRSDTIRHLARNTRDTVNIRILNNVSPRRIERAMKLRMRSIMKPPSGQTNVTFLSTSRITCSVFTGRLYVQEARGIMPRQTAIADTFLTSEMEDQIVYADIRQGKMYLRLTNRLPVTLDTLEVQYPDITNTSGNRLTIRVTNVPVNASRYDSVSLSGYTIRFPSLSPTGQRVRSLGRAVTRSSRSNTSPDTIVTFRAANRNDTTAVSRIDFQYNLGKLTFSRFEGIPDSMTFEFDTTVTTVDDRPTGIDSMGLRAAYFVVSPKATTNIPVDMEINLWGRAPTGVTRSLTIPFAQGRFDSINSVRRFPGAQAILNIVPDTIKSWGRVRIGKRYFPTMGSIRASEADTVSGFARIEGPMEFRMNRQRMQQDPQSADGQSRPVQSVELKISAENHLPVGADSIVIEVSQDTAATLAHWYRLGKSRIARPPINAATRRPTGFTTSDTTFFMAESLINIFEKPKFYVRQTVYLSGAPDTVRCVVSDFIKVRASAKMTINTGEVQ